MSGNTRRKRKKWIIWLVVVVIIGAGVFLALQMLRATQLGSMLVNISSAKSSTGTIEKTVTGTGNLSSEDTTEDITVLDGLKIDQVRVEAGDMVKVGDILATFDAADLQSTIWAAQSELDKLDTQLNQLKDKTETQYVITSVAGRIKQVFAVEGDTVQTVMRKSNALLVLSLDGKMKFDFPLGDPGSLATGDTLTVTLSDQTTVTGTVQSISAGRCFVTISDKTAPVGDEVTAKQDDILLGSGILAINEPLAITATEGSIASVNYELNAKVSSGAKLFKLEIAPVSRTYRELYMQREEKVDQLATLIGYAQENALTAGIAGEVISVGLTDGQTTGVVASANDISGNNAAFMVRTTSSTQLTIDIDELDIALLSVGQEAKITLDALPDLALDGSITEIDDVGTVSQGSTTFTVTLSLPENSSLRLGMSATATITVAKNENVVRIPLEALQESGGEQYVYVGTAVSAINLGTKRVVTTGISDGEYVEIKTGLTSGETINYYYATGENTLLPFQQGGIRNQTTATEG